MQLSFKRAFILSALSLASAQAFADGPYFYALVDGGMASSTISSGSTSTSKSEFVTGGVAPTFVGMKLDKTLEGITVGVALEQGFTLNTPGSSYYFFGNGDIFNRQKNIFVKGSAGSVVVGVQSNIAFGNVLMGDPRGGSNYGSSLAMIDGNGGLGTVDNASISYTAPTMSGLTLAGQYVPESKTGTGKATRFVATYAVGDAKVGVSNYSDSFTGKKDSTGTIFSGNYKLGSVTLKAISASQKSDSFTSALTTTGYGGEYAVNSKLSFDAGFYNAKSSVGTFKVDTTAAGLYYAITKDLKFYTQYAVVDNKGKSNNVGWNFAGPTLFPYTFNAGQKATTLNAGLLLAYF
jgi:hypothetical protein